MVITHFAILLSFFLKAQSKAFNSRQRTLLPLILWPARNVVKDITKLHGDEKFQELTILVFLIWVFSKKSYSLLSYSTFLGGKLENSSFECWALVASWLCLNFAFSRKCFQRFINAFNNSVIFQQLLTNAITCTTLSMHLFISFTNSNGLLNSIRPAL